LDLLEFHHIDNRPVTIERTSVLLMEPHISGSGTLMRVGPIERPYEFHLRDEYEFVKAEVLMSSISRAARSFLQNRAEGTTPSF